MDVCSNRHYDNFAGVGTRPMGDGSGNNYALVGGANEVRRYLSFLMQCGKGVGGGKGGVFGGGLWWTIGRIYRHLSEFIMDIYHRKIEKIIFFWHDVGVCTILI